MVADLGSSIGPAANVGGNDSLEGDDEATIAGGGDGFKEPLLQQQAGQVSDPAQASVLGLFLFQWVRRPDPAEPALPSCSFTSVRS
jgi:hypothetical protein